MAASPRMFNVAPSALAVARSEATVGASSVSGTLLPVKVWTDGRGKSGGSVVVAGAPARRSRQNARSASIAPLWRSVSSQAT